MLEARRPARDKVIDELVHLADDIRVRSFHTLGIPPRPILDGSKTGPVQATLLLAVAYCAICVSCADKAIHVPFRLT